MPGNLQEGAGQGFTGGRLQGGIGPPLFLFFFHRTDEALGDVPLGGRTDARFLLLGVEAELLLELLKAPAEALHHLLRFLAHMGELAIREPRQVGHEHLAVVPQGQKGGTDIATAGVGLAAQGTVGGNGTRGAAASSDAPGITYKSRRRLRVERHLKQPYKQQNLEQKEI